LDISRNKITLINPDTFIHNRELKLLPLQGENITEISKSSFRGLENLEILEISNNNIEELKSLEFHQTFNLKHTNLAQKKIRSFNFELYFSMGSNYDISNPPFQIGYLNVSSNGLTTLDVASMKWLYHTTTVTDLIGNPWNCDCSVLI